MVDAITGRCMQRHVPRVSRCVRGSRARRDLRRHSRRSSRATWCAAGRSRRWSSPPRRTCTGSSSAPRAAPCPEESVQADEIRRLGLEAEGHVTGDRQRFGRSREPERPLAGPRTAATSGDERSSTDAAAAGACGASRRVGSSLTEAILPPPHRGSPAHPHSPSLRSRGSATARAARRRARARAAARRGRIRARAAARRARARGAAVARRRARTGR